MLIAMGHTPHVAVVGAGMVGLATAWFLQEHGQQVTVIDRRGVAAGSSAGNAGWLTPGTAPPFPAPANLRYGVRAMISPSSPVYVPPTADPRLLRFLAGFARHSTTRRWTRAMRAMAPLNRLALDSFEVLAAGGVDCMTRRARPFIAGFRTARARHHMVAEFEHIRAAGQDVRYDELSGDQARELAPCLSVAVKSAIRLHGQRFVDPRTFVEALARAVQERGGVLRTDTEVVDISDNGADVVVRTGGDEHAAYDSVVLTTGAWLGALARRFGVRSAVQAGRGYSFNIALDHLPAGPVYFPAQRVACTPLDGRLRVAGTMEFRPPDSPSDPRRIRAIAEAVRPLLHGADLDDRRDVWVGSRPCTTDGLPLVGRTRSPRVYVAGGHGMWGMTHGPVTGRLLAGLVATGEAARELAPLDPLR